MAPNVRVIPAGGTAEGGIGTDYDAVAAAIEQADDGAGVVVLYDLGSARMVAEMAVEVADNARLVDAPLIEGSVAAAVAAEGGADVAAVAQAAAEAAGISPAPAEVSGVAGGIDIAGGMSVAAGKQPEPAEVTVTLTNEIGLHARPAATVARAMTGFDASVTVHFGQSTADGRSVLALMALGARGGDEVRVTATGPQARDALRTFEEMAADNFGE
jgi:phosphoenolpyruvate---glycerone phosphotransferase subunit DhaM